MDDETPKVQWREDVPPERPEDAGAEPELRDEPMGVPADGETRTGDLPGLPETEPPSEG